MPKIARCNVASSPRGIGTHRPFDPLIVDSPGPVEAIADFVAVLRAVSIE
jgi:hypothetical protein